MSVEINECLHKNISDSDFHHYGFTRIMKYSSLAKYRDIYEVLPKDGDYAIILLEDHTNSGHWEAILRQGNTFIYFDSYGLPPDGENKFLSAGAKIQLHETEKTLTRLFSTLKPCCNLIWNKMKLQKINNGSATCGRHVILFLLFCKNYKYTLKQLQDWYRVNAKKLGLDYDQLACDFVH